jgi:hypothetical protein
MKENDMLSFLQREDCVLSQTSMLNDERETERERNLSSSRNFHSISGLVIVRWISLY